VKLDLGCGPRKKDGYLGVDSTAFSGVDVVHDLTTPWPWEDGSVEAVYSHHFVEHLTSDQRIHFWNELYRVLKDKGEASITTPYWAHACAYGDPTHQWPPMSEWAVYYLNKAWRDVNAPHVPLTCDFDYVVGGSWDQWLEVRQEKTFPMAHYINSWRDLIFTLTKRPNGDSVSK
jgi:SAM-dependent methyltransferase